MRGFVVLLCFCIGLSFPALTLAFDSAPFQLIHRQENVVTDRYNTRSDLLVTVVNLSGGDARDLCLSIPVPNPYFFVDSPVLVGTIPAGRQAETLHQTNLPNDLIALSEPEDNLVWRVEYTDGTGARVAVDIPGIKGQ